jgi:hypothetical protein
LPHRVQHLLGCEVLPHPPSCCPENRFHKAGNTNISLVQFFGDVSVTNPFLCPYRFVLSLTSGASSSDDPAMIQTAPSDHPESN